MQRAYHSPVAEAALERQPPPALEGARPPASPRRHLVPVQPDVAGEAVLQTVLIADRSEDDILHK